MRGTRLAASLVALALPVVAAGCGGDDDEGDEARQPAQTKQAAAKGVFVGKVSGTDAYIGLKSDGERVGGYLCNGKEGVTGDELVSVWLDESALRDGEGTLRSRKGEVVGSVAFSAGKASGEVEVAGKRQAFSARPAPSGKAGIYQRLAGKRGEPGSAETGAVVLTDGSFRGAKSGVTQAGSSYIDPVSDLKRPRTGYIDPTADL